MNSDTQQHPAQIPVFPVWVPDAVVCYLTHTVGGQSIREIARRSARHPSTVMRSIRKLEQRRDDPLVDAALLGLGQSFLCTPERKETNNMTAPIREFTAPDDAQIDKEARRILRRLCEAGAFLAIAADLEKAVVLKENADGDATRIAVVSRGVAEAFALKDWIERKSAGRIATYQITSAGRAALKRLLADDPKAQAGFAEAQAPFAAQNRDWGERVVPQADGPGEKVRVNLAESPLAVLARRKDKSGQPFLSPDLVRAGERLREDFELAQMGARVTQNWDGFLTGGNMGGFGSGGGADGPRAARDRVAAALRDLGPGLGDVVLRCCCYLEGMETAEKRMGWSARSGKIVLRIALQRLNRHYQETYGPGGGLIG
ncbi:hypothetical protein ACMU_07350 [Actibacterium mucosum KCTC 23349]|uniref:DUF6456 domain-containing protein n=1 Tax=Actibacterium mucosum KCTC 23349 TaxID=1454373 RepID=A0A037ZJX0_9RHOB|nr:DUF6456 domain-containing protein [Actibacterium mucosum]KAJ56745.1 hypothetical protein ACMU_07350 [Actibacterium mucosum KCTC 23349]